ncbi:tumor necrosis factor receptor superfamily member 14-like [Pristis pectinata]|uniref:tumor necrosis factor receptor superfamily member 14-like n=1 Tax=Pristis pectinata TaxID=685728 RepID=UPI00223D6CE3|nr:tumor necrosis factor receptor superfamily member 14-like [Pristis pectinata]
MILAGVRTKWIHYELEHAQQGFGGPQVYRGDRDMQNVCKLDPGALSTVTNTMMRQKHYRRRELRERKGPTDSTSCSSLHTRTSKHNRPLLSLPRCGAPSVPPPPRCGAPSVISVHVTGSGHSAVGAAGTSSASQDSAVGGAAPMDSGRAPPLLLCVLTVMCAALDQDCPPEFVTVQGPQGRPCCSRCRPGFFLKEECTATSNSVCVPCPPKSYSAQWNNMFSCLRCAECGYEGMQYKRSCTPSSNAECECSKGYVCEDSDCIRCILQDEDVKNIPCSSGTFSSTGTEPCKPRTNCTSLGHVEIAAANQMRDAICDNATEITTMKGGSAHIVKVVTNIVAFTSLGLLCLSVGLHIATFRKNRGREFNLLPDETQATPPNTLSEDTYNIHFPQQECGISPREKEHGVHLC